VTKGGPALRDGTGPRFRCGKWPALRDGSQRLADIHVLRRIRAFLHIACG